MSDSDPIASRTSLVPHQTRSEPASSTSLLAPQTPLQTMKAVLQSQLNKSGGVDTLSVRMLRAEIFRYEQALKEGTQTQYEQWIANGGGPGR